MLGVVVATMHSVVARAQSQQWTKELAIYGLAAGMSGDVTAGTNTADVNVGFSDILKNLKFGAMGSFRLGYGPWAGTADGIYVDLHTKTSNFDVRVKQTIVEVAGSYRFSPFVEVLAGYRFNGLTTDITGPFGRVRSKNINWWDPVIGSKLTLPVKPSIAVNFRADIGGFGAGSEFAWQAFPNFSWRFKHCCSSELGYRWMSVDYKQGSGPTFFEYDVTTQGPQLGVTFYF
jgi:hypothetical protein